MMEDVIENLKLTGHMDIENQWLNYPICDKNDSVEGRELKVV